MGGFLHDIGGGPIEVERGLLDRPYEVRIHGCQGAFGPVSETVCRASLLDTRGEPVHRSGITAVPGLYFLGLQWLSKMSSSFLSGVGDDAAVLADHIAART